ncbi:EAL domain-containing protein [Pseudocolwellia sp. HL-MZ19]|uniref:EAL domain-containing protein n=1 Tax=Pseudocolwellia sp. HL-MZ19 TaxID=3400846 RepID=UPI003CE74C23
MLQLKWEHEFQFAGYYAALWQGYYKDAGIELEIKPLSRPDGSFVSAVGEIQNGNADFAIGGVNILTAKDYGLDVVVLSSIFQRSQYAAYSLSDTPIENLSQLSKLRIGATSVSSGRAEIEALFMAHGYDLNKIEFVTTSDPIDALLNNEADAVFSYDVYVAYKAKKIGITLNKLDPIDFGANFYGDTLFTSLQLTQRDPELVANFISASKKGWKYALNHKKEIVNRIVNDLPRYIYKYEDLYDYNMGYAEIVDSLINYPEQSIGEVNPNRWIAMNDSLRKLGIVNSHLVEEEFFFDSFNQRTNLSFSFILFFILILLFIGMYISWNKRSILLAIICILLFSYVIDLKIVNILNNEHEQQKKLNLYRQLTSVSAKLDRDLQKNLSMLSGFSAYISAEPNLDYDDFRHYAQEIFKKEPMLINFSAAKDLVVNYIYPLKGNESALGLDYRENLVQKDMVMQVVNTGQLLVAGPIQLVQGGNAFIGRAPIYTGNGVERKLWGIISAPLNSDMLYQRTGILATTKYFNLAIRSIDIEGKKGAVFFGEDATFDDPDNIQVAINVGAGTWQLAATPHKINSNTEINIIIFRMILILSTLIICVFAVIRIRQQNEQLKLQATILTNQELLENVGQVAKIGGWKLDKNLKFIDWSKQSSRLLGKPLYFRPSALDDVSDLFDASSFNELKNNIVQAFLTHKHFELDLELVSDKEVKDWLRVIMNISDKGQEDLITGTMQDVTDKVLSGKIIEHQATYDALTNLPNRVLFNDRLENAMEIAARKNNKVAVLFIDLDRFKDINDNHGHQVGDKLLVSAANRVKHSVRDYDTVSRLSGDEFGVIISDIHKLSDAIHISDKIHEAMQKSYDIDDKFLYCSASIGIAIYPEDGADAASLIQKADQAMYEVKGSGRNGCQFYTKEMQVRSEYRHNQLNDLIAVVDANKITPYFQPIIDLNTNIVCKSESLARWQKDDGTFVPPVEFIELAEESGLINKIDLAMLQNSAQQLISINQNGHNIGLAINISPRIFHTKDKALESWMVCIKDLSQELNITIEITERLLTSDSEKALDVLKKLKEYGVKIAIDDFGTGYSSLSYLIKFPVDIIKIDRSFVDAIGKDASVETLIETILLMAKKLSLRVVAEGIETQEQLDFLKALECDYGQGYFLGRPMPANDFSTFVK